MRIIKSGALALQRGLLLLSVVWTLSSPVLAQVTGTIQGQITDSTKAVVPGAQVTATNAATGVARASVSADDGFYRITDLLPGTYNVKVEMPGFKSAIANDVQVSGEATVGLNLTLEVGEVTESVEVSASGAQVETQVVRISEVLPESEIRSLPVQGRGVLNIVMLAPGIVGKQVQSGEFCCDVFSNYAAPRINSGANEQKGAFSLDGIDLRYSEGSGWGASFTPSPDAVQEVRVTTDPQTSAEYGRTSGPQVQVVTKGGTNSLHGTAHILFQDDKLNARPFFSRTVPDQSYKLFGGTIGGPIIKDRLFFFGAYEGLQSNRAQTTRALVETQAFRDFVVRTRANSIAAKLLQAFPPQSYPNEGLQDLGSPLPGVFQWSKTPDGIPDLGVITLDTPYRRDGNQFNTRIDYHHRNNKDRIFGTYWLSRPEWIRAHARPAFVRVIFNKVESAHFTHTRSFTPTTLNEARFGGDYIDYNSGINLKGVAHIPYVFSDDGFIVRNQRFGTYYTAVYYLEDVFSINRGKHAFKFGGTYRSTRLDRLVQNPPNYFFASILDFADDEPYLEDRVVDTKGGQGTDLVSTMTMGDFAIFMQNTWQIRANLTLNYGLRWETFFPIWLRGKENWQPHLSSAQINRAGIAQAINTQAIGQLYSQDLNNFGPRLGLAWDPSGRGKISVRFGFGVLYDEFNTYPLYGIEANPPAYVNVVAGTQLGIPITYGLAPEGTINYPTNPALKAPKVNARGGIDGQRVNLEGVMTDLQAPRIWDTMAGIQYQLQNDMMVQINYKYRRGTNELYSDNLNRFQGDLLDGRLDRLNKDFNRIVIYTNRGKRIGHTIISNVTKRFSDDWALSASYTYANARNNFGWIPEGNSDFYQSGATDPFNIDIEWARDDIPHTFTAHSIWELPILGNRSDWVGRLFGGWQVNTIWNFQSGGLFIPNSTAVFGRGGDFNADGQTVGYRAETGGGDRPDKPTQQLPSSFSKGEWLRGALPASVFPLPDPSSARPGTLPRDLFRRPGYANVDVAFVKEFRLPIWGAEDGRLQIRGELFNVANRLNINAVESRLNLGNFAHATGAHPNRIVQLAVKFLF